MSQPLWRRFGPVGGTGVLLLLLALGGLPRSSLAQQPPPRPAVAAQAAEGYVGAETCKGCHADQFDRFSKTTMGRLFLKHPRNSREARGCEACHGPGQAHVEAGGGKGPQAKLVTFSSADPTPAKERNALCLQCHEKTARLFWKGSAHESRDVACTNCHRVMENVSDRAQLRKESVLDTCAQCHVQRKAQLLRSSHMPLREGKMDCASCHNPHGTVTPALLKANSVNEICYVCHTEKRGPFLWEHPPVTESCANCHDAHGTNHEKMLKVAKPRLCQQCHVESRHPTRPQDPRTRFVFNRGCVNCHSQIHGSNQPAAAGRFQR